MKQEDIAKAAGLDADTVSKAERGLDVRPATAGALDEALTELERKRGLDLPSQVKEVVETRPVGDPANDLLEVVFEDNNRIVVKGSAGNLPAMREIVEDIIRARSHPQG